MRLDPRRVLVHSALRLMVRRGRIETVAEYLHLKQQNPDPYTPPMSKAAHGIQISEQPLDGMPIYRLSPQQNASNRCFVYFHGGSFIGQIVSAQWELVMELSRASGSTCLVPIYTLAPAETVTQTVARASQSISAAIDEFGAANVSVMGDSAGGTIAVAAVQQMRDGGVPLPARMILLAPWLDLEMTHPDQEKIAPHDIMMRRDYLVDAARVYAGDLSLGDARVSPLFGTFSRLPPMHVFTGSHDVVATDSRQLVTAVHEAGGQIEYVEAPRMQHVYPIFAMLPEARAARSAISTILSQ